MVDANMSTLRDIVVPVVIACVGAVFGASATIVTGGFGYLNKDRELDIKMVDIGLSILKAETAETPGEQAKSENARRFALRLLRKYADVDIPDAEFNAWAQGGNLPLDASSIWRLMYDGGLDSKFVGMSPGAYAELPPRPAPDATIDEQLQYLRRLEEHLGIMMLK